MEAIKNTDKIKTLVLLKQLQNKTSLANSYKLKKHKNSLQSKRIA